MENGASEGGKPYLLLLITIALGMFLDGLDGTIVNVALPEISASFGIDSSTSSWIVTIYFLVLAGMVLIFGKLCDSGMIKRIVILGFLVFSLGSLACGLSGDIISLLLFRAVQGIGASMLAASSIMLSVKFLPTRMTTYGLAIGLLGSSLGAAIGPALGGILTETISWHWIFFINVPAGVIAAVIAMRALPKDPGFDRSSFDYRGSALLFVALVCGLYTVEAFPSHGMTTYTVVSLIAFTILFSLFVLHERRMEAPVLKLALFRSARFDAVVVSFLLLNACYMGALYLLPYFMRVEMGFDTIMCGMYLLIAAFVTLVFCLWVGKAADRHGNRPFVIVGCFCMVLAMATFAIMDSDSPGWVMICGLALLGLVWGVAGGPVGSRLIDNVPPEDRGSGSSILSFFIYFGCALGTAMFSGVFGFGSSSVGEPISGLDPEVFMSGFSVAMTFGCILAVVSLVAAWAVNERKAGKEDSGRVG